MTLHPRVRWLCLLLPLLPSASHQSISQIHRWAAILARFSSSASLDAPFHVPVLLRIATSASSFVPLLLSVSLCDVLTFSSNSAWFRISCSCTHWSFSDCGSPSSNFFLAYSVWRSCSSHDLVVQLAMVFCEIFKRVLESYSQGSSFLYLLARRLKLSFPLILFTLQFCEVLQFVKITHLHLELILFLFQLGFAFTKIVKLFTAVQSVFFASPLIFNFYITLTLRRCLLWIHFF